MITGSPFPDTIVVGVGFGNELFEDFAVMEPGTGYAALNPPNPGVGNRLPDNLKIVAVGQLALIMMGAFVFDLGNGLVVPVFFQ